MPNAAVMIDPELAAAENRRLMGILTKYFATHKHKGHLIQDKKTRDVFVRTTDNEDFSFPVMISKSCYLLLLKHSLADSRI